MLTHLDAAEELGETGELLVVGHKRVRNIELNKLLERFSVTFSAVLTRGTGELHAEGVPESFPVVRAFPLLQNQGATTATLQGISKVTEGGDPSLQLQRRMDSR
jgi:hypothetical protein